MDGFVLWCVACFSWIWNEMTQHHDYYTQYLKEAMQCIDMVLQTSYLFLSDGGWSNNDRTHMHSNYFSSEKLYKFIGKKKGIWKHGRFVFWLLVVKTKDENIARAIVFDVRMQHAVTVCTHASPLPSIINNKLMHFRTKPPSDGVYGDVFGSYHYVSQHCSAEGTHFSRICTFDTMGLHWKCLGVLHLLFRLMQKLIVRKNSSSAPGPVSTSYDEFVNGGTQNVKCEASPKKWYCLLFFSTELCVRVAGQRSTIMCVYESLEKCGPRNALACVCVCEFFFLVRIYGGYQSSEPWDTAQGMERGTGLPASLRIVASDFCALKGERRRRRDRHWHCLK